MGVTEFVLRHPSILALGWALVHFLWQGAIVGVVCAMLLRATRDAAASTRYAIATIAMVVMIASTVGTWVVMAESIVSAPAAADQRSLEGRAFRPAHAAVSWDLAIHRGEPARLAGSEGPALQEAPLGRQHSGASSQFQPTRASLSLSLFLSVYALGVLALSIRLAGGWYVARRLTRRCVKPAQADLVAMADRVADRLALRRVVRVLESSLVTAPAIIGWVAPVVLLPVAALAGLSRAQLEALVAHELAHVKRHDYLVNLLQSAVETLLFYHPAVWWVSRQMRIEREHCCDDVAVALCGDRTVYASALADLETMRGAAFALGANDGSLVSRVRRILSMSGEPRPVTPGWAGIALVLLMVSVVPVVMNSVRASKSDVAEQSKPAARAAVSTQTPKPVAYLIRPTDTLHIVVSGEPTMTRNYAVENDGAIVFPLMRPLKVVGLTTDAVAAAIAKALTPTAANGPSSETAQWLDQQMAEQLDAVRRAQSRFAKLSAYRVDDPATNVETCGVLSEPELRADPEVQSSLATLRPLRDQEAELRQAFSPNYPRLSALRSQISRQLTSLRAAVQMVVDSSQKELDRERSVSVALQARMDTVAKSTAAKAKAATVTVAVVKAGVAKTDAVAPEPMFAPTPESIPTSAIEVAPASGDASSAVPALAGVDAVPLTPHFTNELAAASPTPAVAQAPVVGQTNVSDWANNFVLQSGSTLSISILAASNSVPDRNYKVAADGTISLDLPFLKPVRVAGMTVAQAQTAIADALDHAGLFRAPTVSIHVQFWQRSSSTGEVSQPNADLAAEAIKAASEWQFKPSALANTNAPTTLAQQTNEPCATAQRPGSGIKNPTLQREVKPTFPDWAEQQGLRGVVELEVTVMPDGTTCGIAVTRSLEPRLDAEAIAAAKGWLFTPGSSNGVAMPIRVGIEMTFSAPRAPSQTITVYVLGQVANAGEYQVATNTTLRQVVAAAGGLLRGAGDEIRILRRSDPQATVRQMLTFSRGDIGSGRVSLPAFQNEDIIFFPDEPSQDKATVRGEVKNPGVFEITAGMTVQQALAVAGGATADAALNRISVTRLDATDGKMFKLDKVKLSMLLEPGDAVMVPSRLTRVTVNGAVKTPGIEVPLIEGRTTVLDVVNFAGGAVNDGGEPGPPTFRIQRLDPATGKTTSIAAQASTLVQPGDIVTVRIPMAQEVTVVIHGEVKNPGSYPFREGMTLQQVIDMAGGMNRDGAAGRVRVSLHPAADDKSVDLQRVLMSAVLQAGDVVTVPTKYM